MKTLQKNLALILAAAFAFLSFAACGLPRGGDPGKSIAPGAERSLDAGDPLKLSVDAARETSAALKKKQLKASADFAFDVLVAANSEDGNKLISPLSLMVALGLAANGAAGETRAEIEDMLGMTLEQLNAVSNSLSQSVKNTDDAKLVSANSAWFGSGIGLSVREDYLAGIGKYYGAEIFSVNFSDPSTLGELNGWVERNTDGMIKKIFDELSKDTVFLLMNALTFDADWASPFADGITSGSFKNIGGGTVTVDMISNEESLYISGSGCTGFIKPYAGGNYSYVALLPDSDNIDKFVKSLDGKAFLSLIEGAKSRAVKVVMPKYSLDYEFGLSDILENLGMKRAFDSSLADFSALGSYSGGNIYINTAKQKTHITLDESGTRAAAVTVIGMMKGGLAKEPEYVKLDRPFVYAIIDNTTNYPVFLGVVANLS